MSLSEIYRWLKLQTTGSKTKRRRSGPNRGRSLRPRMEQLEPRAMLTGATLALGGAGGFNSFAGVGFQQNRVASLYASINGQPDTNINDFHAQIKWGDGQTSTGSLVFINASGAQAEYYVKGSHVYQEPTTGIGITVTVTGPAGSSVSGEECRASVTSMPSGIPGTPPSSSASGAAKNAQLGLGGVGSFSSYVGVGFQENQVATLYATLNGQPDTNLSDVHAYINWGDSASWTDADLVFISASGSQAEYQIKGSHIYNQSSPGYPIVVYATGPDGTSISGQECQPSATPMPSGIPGTPPSDTSSGTPANTQLGLGGVGGIAATAGTQFQEKLVANVYVTLNGQPDTNIGDVHVEINWGDSNTWTAGDLVAGTTSGSQAQYHVYGTHTYEQAKSAYPIVVYATGVDGTSISGQECTASVAPSPGITLGDLSATQWNVNEPNYDGTIDVGGGNGGYQGLQVTGLPAGLTPTLESASGTVNGVSSQSGTITLSGTPTQSGTFNLEVSIHDGAGHSANAPYTLTIASAPLVIGSLTPAQWNVNQAGYLGSIPVSGGNGSLSSEQVSGLPAGLSASLSGNGISVTGTPTQSGTFILDVSAEDTAGDTGNGTESLNIAPVVAPALTLGSLTPTQWNVNQPGYRGTIATSGGSGTLRSEQVSGLPTGLSAALSGTSIIITGTPTKSGKFPLQVSVTDSNGMQASGSDTLTIAFVVATSGTTLNLTAGQDSGQVVVAHVTPLTGGSAPSSASIVWGDLSPATAGTVKSDGQGGYVILGDHTYANPNTYPITVTISDRDGVVPPVQSRAIVAADSLVGQGRNLQGYVDVDQPNVILATFQDTGGADPLADYRAVAYFDPSQTTPDPATITVTNGQFAVSSDVDYKTAGLHDGWVIAQETGGGQIRIPFTDNVTQAATTLTLNADPQSANSVNVWWQPIAGAASYQLFMHAGNKAPQQLTATQWTQVANPNPAGTLVAGLTADTIYSFKVVAVMANHTTKTAIAQAQTERAAALQGKITANELHSIVNPGNTSMTNLQSYADALNAAFPAGDINNLARQAAFLGEAAEETSWFKGLAEGDQFNFSSETSRIISLLTLYGPTGQYPNSSVLVPSLTKTTVPPGLVAHTQNGLSFYTDPAKPGMIVVKSGTTYSYYDPTAPQYYGRGFLQLTLKGNYQAAADGLDDQTIVTNPAEVATPTMAARTSVWFWGSHDAHGDANTLADQLTVTAFQNITKNINAASLNETVREADYQRALGALYFGLQPNETVSQIGTVKLTNLTTLLTAIRTANLKAGDAVTIVVSQANTVSGKTVYNTFNRSVIVGD